MNNDNHHKDGEMLFALKKKRPCHSPHHNGFHGNDSRKQLNKQPDKEASKQRNNNKIKPNNNQRLMTLLSLQIFEFLSCQTQCLTHSVNVPEVCVIATHTHIYPHAHAGSSKHTHINMHKHSITNTHTHTHTHTVRDRQTDRGRLRGTEETEREAH